jgi:hypothetical protein
VESSVDKISCAAGEEQAGMFVPAAEVKNVLCVFKCFTPEVQFFRKILATSEAGGGSALKFIFLPSNFSLP